MAKIEIEMKSDGRRYVEVTDDLLSKEEKLEIKYSIYKEINESYQELIDHLPKERGILDA